MLILNLNSMKKVMILVAVIAFTLSTAGVSYAVANNVTQTNEIVINDDDPKKVKASSESASEKSSEADKKSDSKSCSKPCSEK